MSAAAAASMAMPLCLPSRPMVVGVLCVTFSFRQRESEGRLVARCHQVVEFAAAAPVLLLQLACRVPGTRDQVSDSSGWELWYAMRGGG